METGPVRKWHEKVMRQRKEAFNEKEKIKLGE